MLDLTDQLCDICEGGAAPVHNESSVLLTDLSAAHSQSLKAALLNQGAGIVALRPLEGAAGAGKLQRLAGETPHRALPPPAGL